MGKKEKYQDLAEHVVDLLGGKDNISFFTHCITRLRFNLKDQGLAKTAEICDRKCGANPCKSD